MRNVILCLVVFAFVFLFCAPAPAGPIRDFFRGDSPPCAGGVCTVPVEVVVAIPIKPAPKAATKAKAPEKVTTKTTPRLAEPVGPVYRTGSFLRKAFGKLFHRRGR